MSVSGTPPTEEGLADVITVTVDNETRSVWIPLNQRESDFETLKKLSTMKMLVHGAYSSAIALQSVDNKRGTTLLYREQRRLRQKAGTIR